MPTLREKIMDHKYIILVGDPDTSEWSVAVNTKDSKVAGEEYEKLLEDGTPTILIYTGDFITV